MEKVKKAVIYARQSFTDNDENSSSIEVQINNCMELCKKKGFEVVGIFKDADTSSELYPDTAEAREEAKRDKGYQAWEKEQRTPNRKRFKEDLGNCFRLIEQGGIDVLVINEYSRLYRNPDFAKVDDFIEYFLFEHGIELYDCETGTVSNDGSVASQLYNKFKSIFAYKEIKKRRNSALQGFENRRKNCIAYSTAYAVNVEKGTKQITFNPEQAVVVRFIFNSISSGMSYSEILYRLNTEFRDCLPKNKKKMPKGFYQTSIYSIASNLIYAGKMEVVEDGYTIIKDAVNVAEPIIDYALFLHVQDIMKHKKETSGKQKYNVKNQERRHFLPFSGYLKCSHCGSKMVVGIDNGKIFYFCPNSISKKDAECRKNRLVIQNKENSLYEVVQSLFILHCIDYTKTISAIANVTQRENEILAERDNISVEIKRIIRVLSNTLTDAELADAISELKNKQHELNEELNKIQSEKSIVADDEQEKINLLFYHLTENHKIDNNLFSELLRKTVKNIVVFPDKISITLYNNTSFDLPLAKGKWNSKMFPKCDCTTSFFDEEKQLAPDNLYYIIRYYHDDSKFQGEKQLISNAEGEYSILLYK